MFIQCWKISDYAKHTDTHLDFIIYQCNRECIIELDMVRALSFPPNFSQCSLVAFQLKIPPSQTANKLNPASFYICKTVLELRKSFKNLGCHHNSKSVGGAGTWDGMGKNIFSWPHNQEVNPEALSYIAIKQHSDLVLGPCRYFIGPLTHQTGHAVYYTANQPTVKICYTWFCWF